MRSRYVPLNSRDADLDRFRSRILVAAAAVVVGFGLLIGRFFFLQVVQHDYYITRAEDNRIALLPVVPTLQTIARAIAQLDLLAGFAESALKRNWCKPISLTM